MKYTETNIIPAFLEKFPEFGPVWKKNRGNWEKHEDWKWEDPASSCAFMMEFAIYVIDNITSMSEEKKRDIFDFMETLLQEGDEDVGTSVCTGFLESLVNFPSERISPDSFVPFLGKESREYYKGWDDFTGVKTPGLWPDNK